MGEHAAVYGRPAVVAAVDLRLVVEARPERGGRASRRRRVQLELPDIDSAREHSWQEIEELANRARRRWRAFQAGEGPFLTSRDHGDLACIAVGEALASLAPPASVRLRERSLELRVRSEIPVGAGLGSSSAAAVGVVAAVRAVAHGLGGAAPDAGPDAGPAARPDADRKQRPETLITRTARIARTGAAGRPSPHAVDGKELQAIEAAALEVERRQHGFPSGIDSGTVLRGGVLCVRSTRQETRQETRQALRFEHLPRPAWLRNRLLIMGSGTPDHSTGAVVASVRRRYERSPDRVAEVLDRIGAAAEAFREALVTDREHLASAAIAAGHRGLIDLGVVPPAIAVRIGRIEAAGGTAKISGAGALEGERAGALICMLCGRDSGTIEVLSDLAPVDASIGVNGLRFEA